MTLVDFLLARIAEDDAMTVTACRRTALDDPPHSARKAGAMSKWLPPGNGGYTAKPGPTSTRLPPKSSGGAALAANPRSARLEVPQDVEVPDRDY